MLLREPKHVIFLRGSLQQMHVFVLGGTIFRTKQLTTAWKSKREHMRPKRQLDMGSYDLLRIERWLQSFECIGILARDAMRRSKLETVDELSQTPR